MKDKKRERKAKIKKLKKSQCLAIGVNACLKVV